MATQQHDSTPRIPLTPSFASRLETPSDGRLINGFIENTEEGEVAVKRPGISLHTVLPQGTRPGGCYFWLGDIYAIANGQFFKNGAFIGAIGNANSNWSFCSTLGAPPLLIVANGQHLHSWDGVTARVDLAAGHNFTKGLAYLDGTIYAGQAPADIFGSGINDPATWDPLNVIKAQQEPDFIVCVLKHHQYVVAFKNWTIEAFWDAGNPTGSPLQSAPGTLLQFGCRQFESIVQFEDLVIWASATRSGSIGVMMMENLQPQTISTPAIERILQDGDFNTTYAWAGRISGHRFYCLTLVRNNISLVYDITTQKWFQWTYNNGYLPFIDATTLADRRILLQHENGSLYTLSQRAFTDDGVDIPVDIYTESWDGGTRKRKYLPRLTVLGDQKGMHSAKLRWTDDDYSTWSSFRNVDMSKTRPFVEDLGTFYKRAFHLHYNAPTPFRVKALELTNIMLGSE